MIYNEFISYFEHTEIIYWVSIPNNIDCELPELLSLTGSISISKLYHSLAVFCDLPVVLSGLERFLFDIFLFTNLAEDYCEKLFKNLKWSQELESIITNIYRLVDDKNKVIVGKYLFSNCFIDITNLKKVIIYNNQYIKLFIRRCIDEQKEYEIEDLISHYKGANILKDIAIELLNNNCLYLFVLCYPEYESCFDKNVLKIEKYNLISQRNKQEFS